jgi:protein SCO1/2
MHAASPDCKTSSMAAFTGIQRRARVAIVRTLFTVLVAVCATLTACSRPRQYELRGQILAIDRDRHEVTVKHEDVSGLMSAMTMPFKVEDDKLLDGLSVGDLVKATLVVRRSSGSLSSIERTGHEAVTVGTASPAFDLLQPGQPVPTVQLTDDAGKPRTLADWRGRVLAVTFIYTRCPFPDFCPRMDQQFKRSQEAILGNGHLRDRAALLSVSFDPEFDTVPVLAAHAKQIGADPRVWRFATGNPKAIEALASRFGVSVIREGTGADSVVHNLRTAIIGPDGTLREILSGNEWTSADLIDAMRRAD